MSENKLIFSKMNDILADMPAIPKDKKGPQGSYRSKDAIISHLRPVLTKHKVFCVPSVVGECFTESRETKAGGLMNYTRFVMKYTFYAEDGSSVEAIIPTEGSNTGDKGTMAAMAYAFKTMVEQVLCLATEELGEEEGGDEPHAAKKPAALLETPNARQSLSVSGKPVVKGNDEDREKYIQRIFQLSGWKNEITQKPEPDITKIRDYFKDQSLLQIKAAGAKLAEETIKLMVGEISELQSLEQELEGAIPEQEIFTEARLQAWQETMKTALPDFLWQLLEASRKRLDKLNAELPA